MLTRLIALLAALLLVAGAAAPATHAQTPKKGSPTAPAKPDTQKPEAKKELLDINTASADELKALPGIGEAYSKKIIDNRPYQRKDQLVSKKIIPEKTYQGIKDQIIARQASSKK